MTQLAKTGQVAEGGEALREHHRFEVDGARYVYDVAELAIFEVDEAIWAFYDSVGAGSTPAEARERVAERHGGDAALDVVQQLQDLRLLAPAAPRSTLAPRKQGELDGVTLNIAHDCNLRCTYCFAKQGDYGKSRAMMTPDTARAALDFVVERSGSSREIQIRFFGGEPMMNMPAIHAAVEHARARLAGAGRRAYYHITTNGTLLTEQNVQYIADNKIVVQVSVDGDAAINDRFRSFPSGRGSHDVVASGIERLKRVAGHAELHGTINHGAVELQHSLRHLLDDLGGTIVGLQPSELLGEEALTAAELDRIKEEWAQVAEDFLAHARQGVLRPVDNFLTPLSRIHRRRKTIYGCAAGKNKITVTPAGDIYPCHRFAGDDGWKMGNIHSGELNENMRGDFANNTVDQREPCRTCWVRYTCGGGCAHEALEASGTIGGVDPSRCDLARHLTELSLKIYVRLQPEERERLLKGSGPT